MVILLLEWQLMLGLKQYFSALVLTSLAFINHQALPDDTRWLSLDYCSDYYLYQFVAPQNIVAMSSAFMDPNFSHIKPKDLQNVKQHADRLEMIMMLNPDKILLSALAPAALKAQLLRYDFDIVTMPYASSWEDIKQNNQWFGEIVGRKKIAHTLNAKIDQAVMQAEEKADKTALFVGSGDFAIYQGTHYDLILQLLGFSHYGDHKQSYGSLNREEFILDPADVMINLKSMNIPMSQLGDLQGFDFLEKLDNSPQRASLSLSYSLCSSDQLIDAAIVIKEQLQ